MCFLLSQLPETMTDALISEAKRSPAPGPADSGTRKKVFIACIHRPGLDSCVPNILISEKIQPKKGWKWMSDNNLQRNWPLLKIIGCFEYKCDARAAVDVCFDAIKTEGVFGPRDSSTKCATNATRSLLSLMIMMILMISMLTRKLQMMNVCRMTPLAKLRNLKTRYFGQYFHLTWV